MKWIFCLLITDEIIKSLLNANEFVPLSVCMRKRTFFLFVAFSVVAYMDAGRNPRSNCNNLYSCIIALILNNAIRLSLHFQFRTLTLHRTTSFLMMFTLILCVVSTNENSVLACALLSSFERLKVIYIFIIFTLFWLWFPSSFRSYSFSSITLTQIQIFHTPSRSSLLCIAMILSFYFSTNKGNGGSFSFWLVVGS